MTDRPIIFSAPMVRALLEGRKTQTRRLIATRGQANLFDGGWTDSYVLHPGNASWRARHVRYAPGDRLWVREAHVMVPASAYRMSDDVAQSVNPADRDGACVCREGFGRSTGGLRWRPSIHMPRWASRITLTVTEARVQRLQDISEDDAVAEGVEQNQTSRGLMWKAYGEEPNCWVDTARVSFIRLWNSLHGPDAWGANPWVVAVTFTVEHGNIDATVVAP